MISRIDDFDAILNTTGVISEIINFPNKNLVITNFENNHIEFSNCLFNAETITFRNIKNEDLTIRFSNCTLHVNLVFENCKFQNLEFYDTTELSSLKLSSGNEDDGVLSLKRFYFTTTKNSALPLNTNFYFAKCTFSSEFLITHLNQSLGFFLISNSEFGIKDVDTDKNYNNYTIRDSKLHNVCIERNTFFTTVSFHNTVFSYNQKDLEKKKYKNTIFYKNNFQTAGFTECTFENICHIWSSEFKNASYFENIKSLQNSELRIIENIFHKYVTFDKAELNSLIIHKCEFLNIASFQEIKVNKITIEKTSFEKLALFDDSEIRKIKSCNRRTIRIIKQQLQKAENRIDYNRFRSYELSIYHEELKWTWKNGKDKVILGATWLVTGFDHSWRRALVFTLAAGLLFYSLFFISENYMLDFSLSNWREYASGYFRFLLVTDFYNPISERRTYIDNTNTLGWLIFILGKIVIAFGIYEMIQAFRKFKA